MLVTARNEMNYLQVELANSGPNLWTVQNQSLALVTGQAAYALLPQTVMILDGWLTVNGIDRYLTSVSRSEYAQYPNKAQQAPPTAYWFDRLSSPVIYFWPVPDSTQSYTFNFFAFNQQQDAEIPNGTTPDVPYRWVDVMVWGLSERLSYIYAPDKTQTVGARYLAAYQNASTQDVENANLSISLDFSQYSRF